MKLENREIYYESKILTESVEFQTPENIKKIEAILRNPKSSYFKTYRKLDLHDLPDGKPGLCYFAGEDKDLSKFLVFTRTFKAAGGELCSANLYAYKYVYPQVDVTFDSIAATSGMNPKVIRSNVMKLLKFLNPKDMLLLIQNLKKCGFYWTGGEIGKVDPLFVELQQFMGNFPEDLVN